MNDTHHAAHTLEDQTAGATQDAVQATPDLALHADPSLNRDGTSTQNDPIRRGIVWVRPTDLTARAGAGIIGRAMDLNTRARDALLASLRDGRTRLRESLAARRERLTDTAPTPTQSATARRDTLHR